MATDAQVLETGTLDGRTIAPAGGTQIHPAFRDAARLQESLTAPLERRALAWLAARMPAWVHPDHLTLLGLLSMFLAGASYALARWNRAGLILATGCLALNWFGDSLDGTLARFRNRQRPRYGFYVDHVIDTIGGLFLMGGLALSGSIDWRIALGMYIAFLMLAIESYLAAYALGNVTLWIQPDTRAAGTPYRLFDAGGVIAMAAMAAMLVILTTRHTIKLYREETLP
jgi:archaetidylinositol phosphate synthase